MSMYKRPEEILVSALWGQRKQTARDVMRLIFQLLSRLRSISPLFEHMETMKEGDQQPTTMPHDPTEFERVITRFLARDYLYDNPDPSDKSFTPDSTNETGIGTWFLTTDDGTGLTVTVRAGAHGYPQARNIANIEIPPIHQPTFAEPAKMRALIVTLVEIFQPESVTAFTSELVGALDPQRDLEPFGVWMHVPGANVPNLPSPLAEVEFGVAGGTIIHFNVPLPWSKQAKKLRPAFEACRAAGILTPR